MIHTHHLRYGRAYLSSEDTAGSVVRKYFDVK